MADCALNWPSRNLCARDWVQSFPFGTTAEFKVYYNNISAEEKKVGCDSCPNFLIKSNGNLYCYQKYQDLQNRIKVSRLVPSMSFMIFMTPISLRHNVVIAACHRCRCCLVLLSS